MKKMIILTSSLLFSVAPASALDLKTGRASGAVVEQSTGYIKEVYPSPEVDAMVAEVNAKRKAEYERIDKEKGQPVDEVAKIAAQELLKR